MAFSFLFHSRGIFVSLPLSDASLSYPKRRQERRIAVAVRRPLSSNSDPSFVHFRSSRFSSSLLRGDASLSDLKRRQERSNGLVFCVEAVGES